MCLTNGQVCTNGFGNEVKITEADGVEMMEAVHTGLKFAGREAVIRGETVQIGEQSFMSEDLLRLAKQIRRNACYKLSPDLTRKLDRIMQIVVDESGIDAAFMFEGKGTADVVTARFIFLLLAREYTSVSYPQLGAYVGRDHSDSRRGAISAQNRIEHREEYTDLYERCRASIPFQQVNGERVPADSGWKYQ